MRSASPEGHERDLASAYSAAAVTWQHGPARIYDRLAEVLVDASPVPLSGRRVLDVGAGAGAGARAIERAGGAAVAIDLAVGMVQEAAQRRLGVVGDARSLPFAPKAFGGLVAAFCFNHVPDPARALVEAARVVDSGGPVLVSTYADDDHHPVKAAVDRAAAELGWDPAPWVDALRSTAVPVLATEAGMIRAVDATELAEVQIRCLEVPFPELGPSALVAWRCGMAHLAPFVARLDPGQRARLTDRALDLLGSAPPLVRRMMVLAAVA